MLKSLPHPERGCCITPSCILLFPHPQWFIISILISQTHMLSLCFHSPPFIVNSYIPPSLKSTLLHQFFFPLCTFFSRYWPRPPVPVPGGCPGGWASHSQGCSVHSSHRLPWGLPLSAAVECLPGMKGGGGRHVNGSHSIFHTVGFWIGKLVFPLLYL